MRTIKYPFTRFQYPDGSTDRRSYTRLPIRISNNATVLSVETWALVDTGADSTVDYPAESIRLTW